VGRDAAARRLSRLNLPPFPRDHICGAAFLRPGDRFVKVIRPEKNEAPIETQRPARAEPGMPPAVIRLALFALVLVILGVVMLALR